MQDNFTLKEHRPTTSSFPVALVVIIVAILLLGGLAVYFISRNNNGQVSSCNVNGTSYQIGQSFNAADGCNTCSCTANGSVCTAMACTTGTPTATVTVTPTATATVTATPGVTSSVTATPAAGGLSVYFGKPANEGDYNTMGAVARPTDITGIPQFTFVITQVINGPTADEKTAGFTPVLTLSGTSNCGGSAFQFSKSGNTLTVKFCKQLNYYTNPGTGGSFAGIGLQGNGRVVNALTQSLLINGVTKVVIKNPDGSCFAMDSGVNQYCTP